jgi:putative transposase
MHVHLVFVTAYRRGVFNDEMVTHCAEIMRNVCQDFEAEPREFNGERDHVHLLVHYPPKVAVSKLVNSLKGRSGLACTHSASGRRGRRHDRGSGIRAAQSGHRARPWGRLMRFRDLTRGLGPPLAAVVGC